MDTMNERKNEDLIIKITKLNDENFINIEKIVNEIFEKQNAKLVSCVFETNACFDARKHGGPYVAVIEGIDTDGKIIRKVANNKTTVWDSKHKYSTSRWIIDLPIGTKIEARLRDGSWKNEHRSYFIVTESGLQDSDRKTVMGL